MTSTQVFSCEYCEILRTPILNNICERLLLKTVKQQMTWRYYLLSNFYRILQLPFVRFKKLVKHGWKCVTFSNFTKSNTPPWVFFTFYKSYKWHQIAQSNTYFCVYNIVASNFRCRPTILFPLFDFKTFSNRLFLFDPFSGNNVNCVKSVQIRSFFWSLFSCIRTE